VTAALFAAVTFGGAEYCYSGFWMLCGIKGCVFLVVFGGAMLYRLRHDPEAVDRDSEEDIDPCLRRIGILLHILLILLAIVLLAWDVIDVMAILDLFGGEDGWTFGREACGKPFLNSTSVLQSLATRPFSTDWFVDDLQHCAAIIGGGVNVTGNGTGTCCALG
jgi:hypothetical protein